MTSQSPNTPIQGYSGASISDCIDRNLAIIAQHQCLGINVKQLIPTSGFQQQKDSKTVCGQTVVETANCHARRNNNHFANRPSSKKSQCRRFELAPSPFSQLTAQK